MDYTSGIADAIRKASEAYAEALATVASALNDISKQGVGGAERDQIVENWLRVARMSKDGIVTAIEHGFEVWERECRRTVAHAKSASGARASTNPMDAWTENWKKATEAFTKGGGALGEEARKQAEVVQKTLQDGMRTWQKLWDTTKKSS